MPFPSDAPDVLGVGIEKLTAPPSSDEESPSRRVRLSGLYVGSCETARFRFVDVLLLEGVGKVGDGSGEGSGEDAGEPFGLYVGSSETARLRLAGAFLLGGVVGFVIFVGLAEDDDTLDAAGRLCDC